MLEKMSATAAAPAISPTTFVASVASANTALSTSVAVPSTASMSVQPPQTTPPPEKKKKGSMKNMVLLASIVAVLCCAGAGVAYCVCGDSGDNNQEATRSTGFGSDAPKGFGGGPSGGQLSGLAPGASGGGMFVDRMDTGGNMPRMEIEMDETNKGRWN